MQLLRSAVRSLPSASSAEQVLQELGALVVEGIGSWCLADLVQEPDLVTRVVARGADGALELPAAMGFGGSRRSSAQVQGLMVQLRASPRRLLRLSASDLAALRDSAEPRAAAQGAFALALGTVDVAVIGLVSRDALLGVLTVGRSDRALTEDEVEALSEVGRMAALQLDNLRLVSLQRNVAAALQARLLPGLPVVQGLEVAARYVPADRALEVGGDWYDVFSLTDRGTAMVIGDATGHDLEAAARMAELRNLLRACAVDGTRTPAEAISALDAVASQLGVSASATCLYAQLLPQPEGWTMTWSSAGHLPPVLLRDGRATLLSTPPDLMLGVQAASERSDHSHALVPGDLVLLMTDGLVERRRTSLDDRLSTLLATLESEAGSSPELLADRLVERLADGEDDVALLLFQVSP